MNTKHTDSVEAGWREKVRDWWYSVQDLLAEKDVCLHERKRVELEAIIKELEAAQSQQVEEAVRAQAEADQKAFQTWIETRLPVIVQESINSALTTNHQD